MPRTRLSDLMGRAATQDEDGPSPDGEADNTAQLPAESAALSSDLNERDLLDGEVADDDYLPAGSHGLGTATALLLALLVCACGFLAGVEIQKHHTDAAAASGLPTGLPSGLAGGTGGFPGAGSFGGTGAPAGSGAAGTGTGTGTDALAVVGVVTRVSANNVTVTDLGGAAHTVRITRTTTITTTYRTFGEPLAVRQTVSVAGSTADDGSVTASAITVR